MLSLYESFRSALHAIKAHGFRSFLTTLGIIIGVASVIAVVSVIQGLSYSINAQFENLGSNSLTIRADTPLKELLKGKFARITIQDYQDISDKVSGIDSITPTLVGFGSIREIKYGSLSEISTTMGTTYSFQNVNSIYLDRGRFLSIDDNAKRRRVAVIGTTLIESLELPNNPVGEYIQVGNEWFKIIGITEEKGEFFGIDQDNNVFVPFTTMQSLVGRQANPSIDIRLSISDTADFDLVIENIRKILRKNHKLKSSQIDDFKIETPEQLRSSFTEIIDVVTLVLGGIVSISLLVGGIGIMNIMLVSVTERTKEIGICKAIGAKRHHILMQFLIEAIVLSMLGGFIGLAIGYGLGVIASASIPGFPPANVPLWAILTAFGFSAGVGIIFGIIPAAKAANLKPIDALRYE